MRLTIPLAPATVWLETYLDDNRFGVSVAHIKPRLIPCLSIVRIQLNDGLSVLSSFLVPLDQSRQVRLDALSDNLRERDIEFL